VLRIRESFGAKLLTGLLATVGVLLIVVYAVVRSVTDAQVAEVSDEAVRSALVQFEAREELQRRQTERLVRPFVEGRRAAARLDEALMNRDWEYLAGEVRYQFELERLPQFPVTFTDADGRVVLSVLPDGDWVESDPIDVGPLAQALVDGEDFDVTSYRIYGDRLYHLRDRVVELGDRLVGTIAFALPVENADVEEVGALLGIEVCFVVDARCLVGTEMARGPLAGALASLAGSPIPVDAPAEDIDWRINSVPLVAWDPGLGHRVIAVPLDGVVAPFKRIKSALVAGGAGALALALLFGLFLSRSLTRPVLALVSATGKVARGDYETEVEVTTEDEIGTLATAFNEMTRGLLLKERYRSVLNKVVSTDVAEELMKGDVELGGENRHITVLFADIRGFTALTEGMEPQKVIGFLNECMERLSAAVEVEGGVVDKYVGDELMAVFGAPVSRGGDALKAVRAALRMRQAMAELNADRERRGAAPVGLGVGLSTGLAVAGNMGSKERLNYTVLGDTVNLGARLCSGAAAGEILISEATRAEVGASLEVESREAQAFKGFSSAIQVFQVVSLGEASDAPSSGGGSSLGTERALNAGGLRGPSTLAGLLAWALTSAPLEAQEWPRLSDAGLAYISSDGRVQLDFTGQLDLELLAFTGHDAGLSYGMGTFVAPRIRFFTDVFLGDRLYGLIELRSDRGEAPSVGVWEARVEQVFARFSNRAGTLAIQAGRFASPFGTYASRHLTPIDPFIRPPLAYDYRTIMSRTVAPGSASGFLEWKYDPATFRHPGAPPIWGVPYQWGAMLSGSIGRVQLRAAAMNSAPSSEVEAWGWDASRLENPSIVLGLNTPLSSDVSLGASYNRGPYAEAEIDPTDHTQYIQEMFSLDATLARGPLMARAQIMRDRWVVPNVSEDPVEWAYGAEAQLDIVAGVSFALRYGYLDFRSIDDGLGPASSRSDGRAPWDHDIARYEAGLGYRLARNAGLMATFMHNTNEELVGGDPDDDLFAVRLWWAF